MPNPRDGADMIRRIFPDNLSETEVNDDDDAICRVVEDPVPTRLKCTPASTSTSVHVPVPPTSTVKPIAARPLDSELLAKYQPLSRRKLTPEEEAFWMD